MPSSTPAQNPAIHCILWLARQCQNAWHPFWRNSGTLAGSGSGPLAVLMRTASFRQATSFAYVFLLVTLSSVVWGQHLLEEVLVSHVRDMVTTEVRAHQLVVGPGSAEQMAQAFSQREATAPRQERATAVQSALGQLLHGNADLLSPMLCSSSPAPCTGWLRARLMDANGTSHEWLGLAYALPDGGRYVVAYDILPMLDRLYPIPLAGGLSVFAVLLVSLGVGVYFSLGAVRRVDRIRAAMARFTRGNMDARVPILGRQDEFDQLGLDVNQALTRINHLMEEVRNATNHIAHELRTPLTRLQQRLSNIAEAASGNRAIGLELALAEEETQHIQYLFRAVMRISEIETGRCQHDTSPVNARALFADLQDYYGVLAEQRELKLQLSIEPDIPLTGDRALLFQALVNLLDNAIKYAPSHSTITLLARRSTGGAELGVADEGPGIAPDMRAQAVQRFNRLARDRNISGYGLGLPLVQAVASLHSGHLLLSDNNNITAANDSRGTDATCQRGLLALLQLPVSTMPTPNLNDS